MKIARFTELAAAILVLGIFSAAARDKAPEPIAIHLDPISLPPRIGAGEFLMKCAFDSFRGRCLLDTGAGNKILVSDVPPFKKYLAVKSRSNQDISGARDIVDIIRISHLRIGASDFGPGMLKRLKASPHHRISHPIIGPQYLTSESFALRFDGSPTLIINAPAPAGSFEPLSSCDKDRHLLIHARVGIGSMAAIFDTGSGITLVDKKYVANHSREFHPTGIFFQTTDKKNYEQIYKATVSVGGKSFHNVGMQAANFSFMQKKINNPDLHMLLGFNVIIHADWYFDLARQRWSVKKISRNARSQ